MLFTNQGEFFFTLIEQTYKAGTKASTSLFVVDRPQMALLKKMGVKCASDNTVLLMP